MPYLVFKTNPLVSMLQTFSTNLPETAFLTTCFTTSLTLLKSTGTGTSLSRSKLVKFYFSAKHEVSSNMKYQ